MAAASSSSSSHNTKSDPNSRSQAKGAAMLISNSCPSPSVLQHSSAAVEPRPSPYVVIHGPPSPHSITEAYEKKLRTMKNGALLVAGLQKISRFFGICALTWATVVLLGGFASVLGSLDFYLISILLLIEAARLSTAQVFSKLLSKTAFHDDNRPEEFKFKDLHLWLQILWIGSCLVAIVGLMIAAVRLGISGHYPFTRRDESNKSHSNLTPSLYTFYSLVIVNSATAIASGIWRPFLHQSSDDSLMYYHDEVFKTAMTVGMLEADEIDILEFAFKKLASDHKRHLRPFTIKARNKDLIKYMYNSPNGILKTCEYLKSSDLWKQVVAANLPGFWVEESSIKEQVKLFWALQERLDGVGKVAEAAANSIRRLSKAWAQQQRSNTEQHPFLISDPSAPNVVDTLIHLLLHPIKSSLLFQLRALEGCCRSPSVLKHIYNQSNLPHNVLCQELQELIAVSRDGDQHAQISRPQELCLKLQRIVRNNISPRHTAKIYAANALHALLCFGGELAGDTKTTLKGKVEEHILPSPRTEDGKEEYIWQEERDMLNRLRETLGLAPYAHWHLVRVVRSDGTCLPL